MHFWWHCLAKCTSVAGSFPMFLRNACIIYVHIRFLSKLLSLGNIVKFRENVSIAMQIASEQAWDWFLVGLCHLTSPAVSILTAHYGACGIRCYLVPRMGYSWTMSADGGHFGPLTIWHTTGPILDPKMAFDSSGPNFFLNMVQNFTQHHWWRHKLRQRSAFYCPYCLHWQSGSIRLK